MSKNYDRPVDPEYVAPPMPDDFRGDPPEAHNEPVPDATEDTVNDSESTGEASNVQE